MSIRNQSVFLVSFAVILAACASPTVDTDLAVHRLVETHSDGTTVAGTNMSERLLAKMELLGTEEYLPVVVRLKTGVDFNSQASLKNVHNKDTRKTAVVRALKNYAANEQHTLRNAIAALKADNLVRNTNPMWLANVICLDLKAEAIRYLSNFAEIDHIAMDAEQPLFLEEAAWGVRHINSPNVWKRTAGDLNGNGVVVAVLDSGVDLNHSDLRARVWINDAEDLDNDGRLTEADINGVDEDGNGFIDDVVGWDFDADDNDPGAKLSESGHAQGHGTHVAGIIAGDGSGGIATGVAPGAELMILKIGSQCSTWAAMQYALENDADILNMSIGWTQSLSPDAGTWRDMVDNITDAGVLVVTGSGNGGRAPMLHSPVPHDISIPGSVPRALTVSAIGPPDRQEWLDPVAEFASVGPTSWQLVRGFRDYPYPPGLRKPDVTAPGIKIKSTMAGGQYQVKSGNSMAVAHVSGMAALLLDQNPALLPHELMFTIRESAWRFSDPNNVRGWGRVDALSAANYQGEPTNYDLAIEPPSLHWEASDIWVDNDGDGSPDLPVPGITNRVYARIKNLGGQSVGNAELRFYYAEAGTLAGRVDDAVLAATRNPAYKYIGSYNIPVIGPAGTSQDSVTGAVNWLAPMSPERIQQRSLAAVVVSPDPPNAAEIDRSNNSAVDNGFHVKIAPGAESTFSFYLHDDPGRAGESFSLEVVRYGLPMEFDVRLTFDDSTLHSRIEKMRGFKRVEIKDVADYFPGEFDGRAEDSILLDGDRGQVDDIALSAGQPILARLMIKAPEIDSDLWSQHKRLQPFLVLNTVNDYETFGGLSLHLDIDETDAQLRKIIYVRK